MFLKIANRYTISKNKNLYLYIKKEACDFYKEGNSFFTSSCKFLNNSLSKSKH
ncbi:hypothetical protein PGB90_004686 [Kerria lacca]